MRYFFILIVTFPFCCSAQTTEINIKNDINVILDDWHKAVAEYDFTRYFGYMSETSRFLGTDESERWTKQEFMSFSKPYFEKKSTWDFKPKDRRLFISNDQKYAWFDEVLDTWMGPCRGSGILLVENESWKIEQYNLAILVPNDKVNEYLDVIGISRKKASNGED